MCTTGPGLVGDVPELLIHQGMEYEHGLARIVLVVGGTLHTQWHR